jgi:hypothetical protein
MNRTLETSTGWTRLIAALVLLCSLSSFIATAQTVSDKPLDAKSLAALVEELKGVVSRSAPDQKEAAAVAERWDGRKDLAGKTKKEVISLLYEDVKFVIKNSGTLYQIYSIFSFYKRIPDETQAAQTNSERPMDARALTALIKELKEVVTKSSPNKRDAALVAKRWNKRKDLAEKTKVEVINLLFEDVKSVIKDSGIQYQIYSMFSLYKRMPDKT